MSMLNPETVTAALTDAGIPEAEVNDQGRAVTDGFIVHSVPVTHEDRVSVIWHVDIYAHDDYRAAAAAALRDCAAVLASAGYQTEFVTEMAYDCLIAWADGEF